MQLLQQSLPIKACAHLELDALVGILGWGSTGPVGPAVCLGLGVKEAITSKAFCVLKVANYAYLNHGPKTVVHSNAT